MATRSLPKWHNFRENTFGDDECTDPRCGVQVTLMGHMTFSLPCPAPRCTSPKNPQDGCCFTAVRSDSSRCTYCGCKGVPADEEAEVDGPAFTPSPVEAAELLATDLP